jgi:hypothetical protein
MQIERFTKIEFRLGAFANASSDFRLGEVQCPADSFWGIEALPDGLNATHEDSPRCIAEKIVKFSDAGGVRNHLVPFPCCQKSHNFTLRIPDHTSRGVPLPRELEEVYLRRV